MADRLVRVAEKNHRRDMKMWKDDMDQDMRDLVDEDLVNAREIAKLIRQNKLAKAWQLTWELDTDPREQFPDSEYNWLSKEVDGE